MIVTHARTCLLRPLLAAPLLLACSQRAEPANTGKQVPLRAAIPQQTDAAVTPTPAGAPPPGVTENGRPSLAPLVQRVRGSVVGVTTHSERATPEDIREFWRRFFGGQMPFGRGEETGIGSGVVVDPSGIVLTNNHVVAGAQEVRVKTADGKEYAAQVRGTDPPTDLAVLRIRDLENGLTAARFGDSDRLRVGDYVIAIGSPFGLALTVTNGIVSAKARVIGVGPYDEFLQTDAAINPGNSGGPLFDLDGNVVGINTAIVAAGQGIGFAVPIDLVKALLPQLEEKGRVVRGFIGVVAQDMTPELATALGVAVEEGALLASAEPGGPAAKAGLKAGDIVISLNGEPVTSAAQLSRQVALLAPGEEVVLEIVREKKKREVEVTLGERPSAPEERPETERPQRQSILGLELHALPPEAKRLLGVEEGALVTDVQPGSLSSKAGVQPGDVIVEANKKRVKTPQDFLEIAKEAGKKPLLLRVIREGHPQFLAINPE